MKMNYKQALKEKNLEIKDLSKALQNKITSLERSYKDYVVLKEDDDVEIADLEELENKIADADSSISKSVLRFNPEVLKKRQEIMKNARKSKKEEEKVEEVVKVAEEKGLLQEEVKPIKEEEEVKVQNFVKEEQEFVETEEVSNEELEEFAKKASVKPKGVSVSFMLMGLGAFLLTWGAVNLYRAKKR